MTTMPMTAGWKMRVKDSTGKMALEILEQAEQLATRPESPTALAEYERLCLVYDAAFDALYDKSVGHNPELVRYLNRQLGYPADCKGTNYSFQNQWVGWSSSFAVSSVGAKSTVKNWEQETQRKRPCEDLTKLHSDPAKVSRDHIDPRSASVDHTPVDGLDRSGEDTHNRRDRSWEAVVQTAVVQQNCPPSGGGPPFHESVPRGDANLGEGPGLGKTAGSTFEEDGNEDVREGNDVSSQSGEQDTRERVECRTSPGQEEVDGGTQRRGEMNVKPGLKSGRCSSRENLEENVHCSKKRKTVNDQSMEKVNMGGQVQEEETQSEEERVGNKEASEVDMACDVDEGGLLKEQKRVQDAAKKRSNLDWKMIPLTVVGEELQQVQQRKLPKRRGDWVDGGSKGGRRIEGIRARKQFAMMRVGLKGPFFSSHMAKAVALRKASEKRPGAVSRCPYCNGMGWIKGKTKKVWPAMISGSTPGSRPGIGTETGLGVDKVCGSLQRTPRCRAKRNDEKALSPVACANNDASGGVRSHSRSHKEKEGQFLGGGGSPSLDVEWQNGMEHYVRKKTKTALWTAQSAGGQLEGNYNDETNRFEINSRCDLSNSRGVPTLSGFGKRKCVTRDGGIRSKRKSRKGFGAGDLIRDDEAVEQGRKRKVRRKCRGVSMGEEEKGGVGHNESNHLAIHRSVSTKHGGLKSTSKATSGLSEKAKGMPNGHYEGRYGKNRSVHLVMEDIAIQRSWGVKEGEKMDDELGNSEVQCNVEGLAGRKQQTSVSAEVSPEGRDDHQAQCNRGGLAGTKQQRPVSMEGSPDIDSHGGRMLTRGTKHQQAMPAQVWRKREHRAREQPDEDFSGIARRLSMGNPLSEARRGCASPQSEKMACNEGGRENMAAMDGVKGRCTDHQRWGQALTGQKQANGEGVHRRLVSRGFGMNQLQVDGKSPLVDQLQSPRADSLFIHPENTGNKHCVHVDQEAVGAATQAQSFPAMSDPAARICQADSAMHKSASKDVREEEGPILGATGHREERDVGGGSNVSGFNKLNNARPCTDPKLEEELVNFSWQNFIRWQIPSAPADKGQAFMEHAPQDHHGNAAVIEDADNAARWWDVSGVGNHNRLAYNMSLPFGMYLERRRYPWATGHRPEQAEGVGEDMGSSVNGRPLTGRDMHKPQDRRQQGQGEVHFGCNRIHIDGQTPTVGRTWAGSDWGHAAYRYTNPWGVAETSPGVSDAPTGNTEVGSVDPKMNTREKW